MLAILQKLIIIHRKLTEIVFYLYDANRHNTQPDPSSQSLSSSHRIQLIVIHLRFKNLDVFVWWSADVRVNFWDHKKKEQRKEKRQQGPAIRHVAARLVTKKVVTRLLNKSAA